MSGLGPVVTYDNSYRAVVNESNYYGLASVDLVGPPRRLYADGIHAPPLLEQYVDSLRVKAVEWPTALLGKLPLGDNWLAQSARSLGRLQSLFLLAEDPQERLVGRAAATLAHQASLTRFVLSSTDLQRVLIADEVGLGKTIEAGLIIKGLLEQKPGIRVLYLAPARLVSNVYQEFRDKLDLQFRMFSADDRAQADIRSDPLVVASIHRAVHPANRSTVEETEPWDVLIVDECHHLSARGPAGQDANEQFDLVRTLVQRQGAESRLLLMSGTPHQGNRARFENLLSLLVRPQEPRDAVRGRVIFRTKDNVRDWSGKPLFPRRDVRAPKLIELGQEYRNWYEAIGELYENVGGSEARRRAGGWAKGQALQWAASSVQAGMGFLVRLGIRRLDWDLNVSELRDGLAALRPYKGGKPNEDLNALYARVRAEIDRQKVEDDLADMEEVESEPWRPDHAGLCLLLKQGLRLLDSPAATAKWEALLELLAETPNEKIVLFAQPVETVTALARFLESKLGQRPAIIIGGQKDHEREGEIKKFRNTEGARLLVSSRAGGEGINLQVSRRLVHIDVPWNPMEMEQRVGRVHRFGSKRTILVDTLLVKGTREVDAYRIAREKLAIAFGDLARDPEKFEVLFARVMSLIPPQPLEEIISRPLIGENSARLGELVEDGLRRWREFHSEFAAQQNAIRELDPGAAQWEDLATFLIERHRADPVDGCTIPDFHEEDGEVITTNVPVRALRLDGRVFVCADTGGVPAVDAQGQTVPPLGLNTPEVVSRLRALVFPNEPTGAAWLRPPEGAESSFDDVLPNGLRRPFGVIAVMRQTIRTQLGTPAEQKLELHLRIVSQSSEPFEPPADKKATIVRLLIGAVRQREPVADQVLQLVERMSAVERGLLPQLGRPTDAEHQTGIRHAVWPAFAAVVS